MGLIARDTLYTTLRRAATFCVGALVGSLAVGAGYHGWGLYVGIVVVSLVYGHISATVNA